MRESGLSDIYAVSQFDDTHIDGTCSLVSSVPELESVGLYMTGLYGRHFSGTSFVLLDTSTVKGEDNSVVGFLLGCPSGNQSRTFLIAALGVAQHVRRRGLATSLLRHAEVVAKQHDMERAMVSVRPDNHRAALFWRASGYDNYIVGEAVKYSELAASRDYYGKGWHEILFSKEL